MNPRETISAQFADWLRTFPLLVHIGTPSDAPEVLAPSDEPAFPDTAFWIDRTLEAEALALEHMPDAHIDAVFEAVATIFKGNHLRFVPLGTYYGRFAEIPPLDWERDAAEAVVRDLGWAACELLAGEPGFFTSLLPWYDRGRWPIGWDGEYPAGRLRVL